MRLKATRKTPRLTRFPHQVKICSADVKVGSQRAATLKHSRNPKVARVAAPPPAEMEERVPKIKEHEQSLADIVRALYDEGHRDEDTFPGEVLARVLYGDDPESMLLPVVRQYTLTKLRGLVRVMEHETFRERGEDGIWHRKTITAGDGNAALRVRLNGLLDQMIWIPSPYATRVKWGSATVEMLEARTAMYQKQRREIDSAMADLADAITLIQGVEGATCLNDVYVTGS